MARSEKREQRVSDEEFESMPEKIGEHFDRIRSKLTAKSGDDE